MNGILLVDKPKDWTSFDVVAKVRGTLRAANTKLKVKVGHTGTLDPLATGLLVLLVGNYTKKASGLIKLDKTYQVTIKLGQTSTTGDEEGKKEITSPRAPDLVEINKTVNQFVGKIWQTPPAFSAIKIDGQRAYKLARAGKEVKIEPRAVNIYSITNVVYEYPQINFTANVSSGTYIRTLAEDIGIKLGTGAYMSDLRRTKVGTYKIQNAVNLADVTVHNIDRYVLTIV